jgi:hypothetical protein
MTMVERIARRLGVTALPIALAVASLLAASTADAQCGQDFRGAPASSTVPGGPPLAIGDSVLADAVPQLVRYGFEADGMVCRQMSQGLDLLRTRTGRLPRLVVLALGANGEVTDRQINEALGLLGPRRVLVLVTPHGGVLPSTPGVIRAAAAVDPSRIVLLDWDRLADEHKDWLAPDGVHLGGPAGIEGFAAMVAGALRYATPESTGVEGEHVNPGTPKTLPSPAVNNSHPRRTHHARKRRSAQPTTRATARVPLPALRNPATETAGRISNRLALGIAVALALAALVFLAWRHARHRVG